MSATLTTLCTDDVDATFEGLGNVFGVSDHAVRMLDLRRFLNRKLIYVLHDGDTRRVQLVDHLFGRDADGADEEGSFVANDDICELGELTFGVVILIKWTMST